MESSGREEKARSLVEVHRALTAAEATEIVAVLGANGIPATTKGEALGEILGLPGGPLAEVRILVPAEHADRAREVLSSRGSAEMPEEPEEEGPPRPTLPERRPRRLSGIGVAVFLVALLLSLAFARKCASEDPAERFYALLLERSLQIQDAPPAHVDAEAVSRVLRDEVGSDALAAAERIERAQSFHALVEAWIAAVARLDPDRAAAWGLAPGAARTRYDRRSVQDRDFVSALALGRARAEFAESDPDARLFEAMLEYDLLHYLGAVPTRPVDAGSLDPSLPLRGLDVAYDQVVRSSGRGEELRPLLVEILSSIPAAIEDAKENLGAPPRLLVEATLEDLGGYRELVSAWEATDEVLASLDAYRSFLEERIAQASPSAPMSPERLRWYVEVLEHSERTPSEIRDDLLTEENHLRLWWKAADVGRDGWAAEGSWSGPMAEFEEAVAALRSFTFSHRLVSFADEGELRLEWVPPHRSSYSGSAFYYSLPLADSPDAIVCLPRASSGAEEVAWGIPGATLTAAHETYPGHHVHEIASKRAASIVRRIYPSGWLTEGWASYGLQLLLDEGFVIDPDAREVWYAVCYHQVWLALLDLCLQAGTVTETEAEAGLVEGMGYSGAQACRVLAGFARSPLHSLSYALGERKIRELRDRLEYRLGSRFDPREFHERLLAFGRAPIGFVAEEMERTWK
jgi:hypothetical protein